jgi:hypothetical protein
MSRQVLDAGALIALDRDDRAMWERLAVARSEGKPVITNVAVVAQVWRGGRHARLAQALEVVSVLPLEASMGRALGELLAESGTEDVVDASVVLLSRAGDQIFTSDVDDLLALATAAELDVEIVRV